MSWELYVSDEPRRTKAPTVTIQKDRTISLNRPAWESIGSPKHVQLWFETERNLIGIRPVPENTRGALNVTHHVARYFRISATGFINDYGIRHNPSRRFYVRIDRNSEDGPILVVDLKSDPDWVSSHDGDEDPPLEVVR
jgi:hypothetical protein